MNNPKDEIIVKGNTTGIVAEKVKLDLVTLVQDTLDLKTLLEQETLWLKAMKVDKVKACHDDKLRLIRRLEIQKDLIKKDPSIMNSANEEEKIYLQDLQIEMAGIMKENFAEVLKAKEINMRVVDVIAKAVNKHNNKASGYGNSGYSGAAKNVNVDRSYAVTVNQTI